MKKYRFFVLLLSAFMTFSTLFFSACNTKQTKENTNRQPEITDIVSVQPNPKTPQNETDRTLLTSFETYDEVVNMRLLNSFGKAQISSDHATEGSHSFKLTVNGNYITQAHPTIAIPTKTEYIEKTDFTDVDKIYLDVYNANDSEQTVYFSYLLKKNAATAPSSETACTIGANQSATLTFELNRDLINYFVDLENVLFVRISFDCASEYMQPYRNFYIDNLRYSTTTDPIDDSVNLRKEDEIESCDSADFLMAWSNINQYTYAPSVISFNKDSRYIKEGTGSFRVNNVPNTGVTGTGPTYNVGWKINPKVSDMRDYYSYSFWIYNDCDQTLKLRASYHYSTGVNYPTQGSEELDLKPNDWTYVEVTTEHLLANGVNPKNFNWLSISVWVPRTVPYSFYFDAVYLNKTPSEHKEF